MPHFLGNQILFESETSLSCFTSALQISHCLAFFRTMIQNIIKEGKIVPAKVTIKLLQKAIMDSGHDNLSLMGSQGMRRIVLHLRML